MQDVTATDVARLLRGMRDTYSPWTCVAVYRHPRRHVRARVRRGDRDPLARSTGSHPRSGRSSGTRSASRCSTPTTIERLVAAGTSERWRAALGLAGYAGLRLGEIRALTWGDVDLEAGTIAVRRSLLPDGTPKAPKTEAGVAHRADAPALRRLLVEWKLAGAAHARRTIS